MNKAVFFLVLLAGCDTYGSGPGGNTPATFYVTNKASSSLTAFTTADTGDASPASSILGTNTTLDQPEGIVLDPTGIVITTSANPPRILVFASHAAGDVPPVTAIVGTNTRLSQPKGLALDPAGRLFVADAASDSILVFANGASGNVAPISAIGGSNTLLAGPTGIAFDIRGRVYVANSLNNSVTVYAAGASGNAAPIDTIAGPNTGLDQPLGVAVDPGGRIYVASATAAAASSRVTVYAATAKGNATPIATITGASTGLDQPQGIALAGSGRIYVVSSAFSSLQFRITAYDPNANGDVAPVVLLRGAHTGLSVPSFISF